VAIKDDKLRDVGLLVLRVGLGGILIYYGLQKAFGAFDGNGFQLQLQNWEERNIPRWLGTLAILSEFGGSIAVILGLLTRVGAFGIMCTMAVAAFMGASKPGAMMSIWVGERGSQSPVFYPLAMMFMAAALMLTGPGGISIDSKIFKRGKK
jgi:putative oxidoreductase